VWPSASGLPTSSSRPCCSGCSSRGSEAPPQPLRRQPARHRRHRLLCELEVGRPRDVSPTVTRSATLGRQRVGAGRSHRRSQNAQHAHAVDHAGTRSGASSRRESTGSRVPLRRTDRPGLPRRWRRLLRPGPLRPRVPGVHRAHADRVRRSPAAVPARTSRPCAGQLAAAGRLISSKSDSSRHANFGRTPKQRRAPWAR
jgi:hypothetical protein